MKKAVVFLILVSFILNLFMLSGCGNKNEQQAMGKIEFKAFTNDDVTFENDEFFIKNQLLITADEKLSYSDVETAIGKYGGKIVGCIEFTNDYQVEFDNADYNELTEIMPDLLNDLPNSDITFHNAYTVDSASKDYKESYTNDYSKREGNWWRQAIQLTDLESKNYNYQTVKVGLIDSLFDTQNPDLSEYFVRDGIWYNDESKLAEEASGSHGNHGTNVTGFLAAKKGNGKGIDGVANNVELFGVAQQKEISEAFSEDLYNNYSSSMKWKYSIAQLLSREVKIINLSMLYCEMSVGSAMDIRQAKRDLSTYSENMETFLKKFIDHGKEFVIVKCAGNMNGENYIYCKEGATQKHPYGIKCYNPKTDGNIDNYTKCTFTATADYDVLGAIKDETVKNRIIIVGSSTKDNSRANHSVCGERIDIYAPGENLTELTIGEDNGTGTSYATPIVSGVVALTWGINPDISADNIKYIIKSQATKPIINELGKTESYKFLVNADRAVEFAKTFKKTIVMKSGENNGKLLGYVRKLNDNQGIEEIGSSCDVSIYRGNEKEAYSALTESNYNELKAYSNIKTDINGEFDIDLQEGDYYLVAKFNNGEYQSVIKTFKIYKGEVCYLDDIILSKKTSNQSTTSNNDISSNGIHDMISSKEVCKSYLEYLKNHSDWFLKFPSTFGDNKNIAIKDINNDGVDELIHFKPSDGNNTNIVNLCILSYNNGIQTLYDDYLVNLPGAESSFSVFIDNDGKVYSLMQKELNGSVIEYEFSNPSNITIKMLAESTAHHQAQPNEAVCQINGSTVSYEDYINYKNSFDNQVNSYLLHTAYNYNKNATDISLTYGEAINYLENNM